MKECERIKLESPNLGFALVNTFSTMLNMYMVSNKDVVTFPIWFESVKICRYIRFICGKNPARAAEKKAPIPQLEQLLVEHFTSTLTRSDQSNTPYKPVRLCLPFDMGRENRSHEWIWIVLDSESKNVAVIDPKWC